MTRTSFEAAWREAVREKIEGVQLVDAEHPLELYTGVTSTGQPVVQIRSSITPTPPGLSDLVEVESHEYGDHWVLSLVLRDQRFLEAFIRLTTHVIDRSARADDEHGALRAADSVFEQWRRLMQPRPIGLLSIDRLRGLIGEIWYLREVAATAMPLADAISGWTGPLGTPQDFFYPSSGFHEIKTVAPGSRIIQVSSAEQLDAVPLQLIVIQVAQMPTSGNETVTLHDLARGVEGLLTDDPQTWFAFQDRVTRLGVDLSDPYYATTYFSIHSVSTYQLVPEFPAIRATLLPAEVSHVRYDLNVAALEKYKLSQLTYEH